MEIHRVIEPKKTPRASGGHPRNQFAEAPSCLPSLIEILEVTYALSGVTLLLLSLSKKRILSWKVATFWRKNDSRTCFVLSAAQHPEVHERTRIERRAPY